MRLAILGTRGIPASYGGFETFAEELGTRLAARGHDVTVYGRAHHVAPTLTHYKGVRIVVLPTVRHKYLDTVVHTALSVAHARGRYEVVLICNAANAVFCLVPRLFGTPVALNVDGIERKRAKWSALGRGWYLASEWLATRTASAVVTDARVIERYYLERYGCRSTCIPYGCTVGRPAGTATLERLGVQPRGYILYVSRLEPENNAHAVIAGFEKATRLGKKLLVVGDAPYARDYIARLHAMAGPDVIFTGAIYGEGYHELQAHAFAYVHATEVGGTHPALVEAMGAGGCVVVNDVPENREVAGEAALYFRAADPATLAAALERLSDDPTLADTLRARARERAAQAYSWDTVTDTYEDLFRRLAAGASGLRPSPGRTEAR